MGCNIKTMQLHNWRSVGVLADITLPMSFSVTMNAVEKKKSLNVAPFPGEHSRLTIVSRGQTQAHYISYTRL